MSYISPSVQFSQYMKGCLWLYKQAEKLTRQGSLSSKPTGATGLSVWPLGRPVNRISRRITMREHAVSVWLLRPVFQMQPSGTAWAHFAYPTGPGSSVVVSTRSAKGEASRGRRPLFRTSSISLDYPTVLAAWSAETYHHHDAIGKKCLERERHLVETAALVVTTARRYSLSQTDGR